MISLFNNYSFLLSDFCGPFHFLYSFIFFEFWLKQGNVGMIFTKGDLKEVSDEVSKYKVAAPARVGLVAPVDVVVPPGNTGLDPSQTSFFQVTSLFHDMEILF